MNNELSIILLVFEPNDVSRALDNIDMQTLKDLEVYILTSSTVNISTKMKNTKYHIINAKDDSSLFQNLVPLAASLPGNFITFMNCSDINSANRFNTQIQYLNTNNLNICSCREMAFNNDRMQNNFLTESNRFTDADSINSAISAAYLPLDLYTFVYRKSFLEDIASYSRNQTFESEIDLILYFLHFEKINKIPQVLYYVKKSRIPYAESSFYYDSPNATNKLAIFNRSRVLERQDYFRELLNTKKTKVTKNSDKIYNHTIIAIMDSVNIGGTETYVLSLANRLKREHIQLCVFTKKCIINEWFVLYDIPLYVFDINNKSELEKNISSIDNLSLIQIHTPGEISLASTLKSIVNVPITFTIHGIYYSEELIRSYLHYIDTIVFVSKYVGHHYMHLLNEQSYTNYTIIPNGFEVNDKNIKPLPGNKTLRETLGIPEESILILYCSRLSFNKATMAINFLKSFEKIANKYDNIYSLVIGDGNSAFAIRNAYLNNSYGNNKNKRIFLLGSRFNILSYFSQSDIVVGTGRVALEAMSTATPVIAFGSNLEVNIVTQDNISTIIDSNFGDHYINWHPLDESTIINKLYDYTEILITSKEKRTELGLWSKSYVTNYLSLDKLSDFYVNMCKNEN